MQKTVKVIMLGTERSSKLRVDNNGVLSFEPDIQGLYYNGLMHCYRHLYLTSDEEIKEGDWYIQMKSNGEIDSIKLAEYNKTNDFSRYPYSKYCTKIIATTDKSLYQRAMHSEGNVKVDLPQIPESFVEDYVKADGKIDEVQVEYDVFVFASTTQRHVHVLNLREDNSVIIQMIK